MSDMDLEQTLLKSIAHSSNNNGIHLMPRNYRQDEESRDCRYVGLPYPNNGEKYINPREQYPETEFLDPLLDSNNTNHIRPDARNKPSINRSDAMDIPSIPTNKKRPVVHSRKLPALEMNNLTKTERQNSYFDSEEMAADPYLTPAKAPEYSDILTHESVNEEASKNREAHDQKGNPLIRNQRVQRFDSGVECESDHNSVRFSTCPSISSSTGSVSLPRLSTHYETTYEDIDTYNKPMEVKNKTRNSTDKSLPIQNGCLPHIRPLPHVDISGITHSDSDDAHGETVSPVVSRSIQGRSSIAHQNDQRLTSVAHTYTPLNYPNTRDDSLPSKSKPSSRSYCWLALVFILLFMISVTSLALSIYVLLQNQDNNSNNGVYTAPLRSSQTNSSHTQSVQSSILELKEEISHLKKENEELRTLVSNKTEHLNYAITPFEQSLQNLTSSYQNVLTEIQSIKVGLETEITSGVISPGPQGPPGVANFSLCQLHTSGSINSAHKVNRVYTQYLPKEVELKNHFVIFAFCGIRGATNYVLEMREESPSLISYRCGCWGVVDSVTDTTCYLNYWMCPR